MVKALEALATARAAGADEPKVEVINTLPKYYGRLYQHHIDVLERSLAPAVSAIAEHLDQSDEIRQHLRDLVQQLRQRKEKAGEKEVIIPDYDNEPGDDLRPSQVDN